MAIIEKAPRKNQIKRAILAEFIKNLSATQQLAFWGSTI